MDYVIVVVFDLAVVVLIVVGIRWYLRRRAETARISELREPDWSYAEHHPPERPGHEQAPDLEEHSLDLESWTYKVFAIWYNFGIEAESDTSVVREEFEVRRADHRTWEIRLATRNGSKLEGRPWQPAPRAFVGEWETAYSHMPKSHEALLGSELSC